LLRNTAIKVLQVELSHKNAIQIQMVFSFYKLVFLDEKKYISGDSKISSCGLRLECLTSLKLTWLYW
jgi:hypothetical protein